MTHSVQKIIAKLKAKARLDQLKGMARFGIVGKKRLGVSMPDIRALAKEIGQDHVLALKLWATGIPDAQILAAIISEPDKITSQQMEDWVKDINSWDVCDQTCMIFDRSPLAWKKVYQWSRREEEFVKRAAFALIACLATHDKEAADAKFIKLLPIIKREATDERNLVKKAVNWALRGIGKRNKNLNRQALKMAREISKLDSKVARWNGRDAIRELESEAVQKRLNKKSVL